jgi:protein tyrosine/serine phosphatase
VKKKNPLHIILTILLIVIGTILLVRHFHIKNFHIICPDVLYTSGQPRGMDYYRLLYKYHIATIINLRSPAEHREKNWHNEEITWVRSNGIKYIEMPLERDINGPGHFPDANTQEQFLAIMADKENLPVLIHDGSGENRVAALTAVWLLKSEQLPVQKVIEIFSRINATPPKEPQIQFINSLIK